MPNIRRLAEEGTASALRSCEPPITVPAWAVMMTGQTPGELGVYGFCDRASNGYGHKQLASSLSYSAPPLWQLLSEEGKPSCILNVPQTYPPQPFFGRMLCGLLTPDDMGICCWPSDITSETKKFLGQKTLDVENFRHQDLADLVEEVRLKTCRLFDLACAWQRSHLWEFFMVVDMGSDRLQHALWRYCIDDHPNFIADHPLGAALEDYYALLDTCVGRVVQGLRADDVVMVVSDHGAGPLRQAMALNQWLVQEGYLVLAAPVSAPAALQPHHVDWPKTRLWADGGYVGRLHINQRGREPMGAVAPEACGALLHEVQKRLWRFGGEGYQVRRPADLYPVTYGHPPDAFVYLDNLRIRATAQVGVREILCEHNDTGPDGANHRHEGTFIIHGAQSSLSTIVSIYDIAPTVLHHLGARIPASMRGAAIA